MFLYLIILINIFLFPQNFAYDENDWVIVSNPGTINSICNRFEEIIFTSSNGVFSIDINDNSIIYMPEFIRGFNSKKKLLIHYDIYRDHLWFIDSEKIYFKPYTSTIWREIDYYEININHYSNIHNIGSDHNYIYIKNKDEYIVLDPFTGRIVNQENREFIDIENIIWSASKDDVNPNNIDILKFRFTDINYHFISAEVISYFNNYIYITSIIKDENNFIWVGTDTGELFKCNVYLNTIEKINNIPLISNIKLSYLDDNEEWWMAVNERVILSDSKMFNNNEIFLVRWIEKNNEWRYYSLEQNKFIDSFNITALIRVENYLFVGTDTNCMVFDIMKEVWINPNYLNEHSKFFVYDMIYYSNQIYLATSDGLKRMLFINSEILIDESISFLKKHDIFNLAVNEKLLIIASEVGLFSFNEETNELNQISDKLYYNLGYNKDLLILANQKNIYKLNNQLSHVKRMKNIENFCFVNDYLWINNKNKASLLNIHSIDNYEYNTFDGIPGDIINHINCNSEWVWFSTNEGLALFNWGKYYKHED